MSPYFSPKIQIQEQFINCAYLFPLFKFGNMASGIVFQLLVNGIIISWVGRPGGGQELKLLLHVLQGWAITSGFFWNLVKISHILSHVVIYTIEAQPLT